MKIGKKKCLQLNEVMWLYCNISKYNLNDHILIQLNPFSSAHFCRLDAVIFGGNYICRQEVGELLQTLARLPWKHTIMPDYFQVLLR